MTTGLENLSSLGAAITAALAKNSVQIISFRALDPLNKVRCGSLIRQRISRITFSGNTKNHELASSYRSIQPTGSIACAP